MKTSILLAAQTRKEFALLKHYYLNTLVGFAAMILLFVLLFLGYKGLAGGSAGYETGLSNLLTGYVMWMLALLFYQDIADTLRNEAREGILEMLYMSPYGYLRVSGMRLAISFLWNILLIGAISVILLRITGKEFDADLISLLILLLLFLLPMIGISLVLGGVQLIAKKIDTVMGLIQFVLVAFVALPVDGGFYWARFLPGVMASYLSREVSGSHLTLAGLPVDMLVLAALSAAFYLGMGIAVYKLCEKRALRDGHLAHY